MKGDLTPARNSTRLSGLSHDGWECILEYRLPSTGNYIAIEGLDIDSDGGEYCIEAFQKSTAVSGGALRFTINGVGGSAYSDQFMEGYLNAVSANRATSQSAAYLVYQAGGAIGSIAFARLHLRRIGTKYVYGAHSAGDIIEGTRHGDTIHWSGEIDLNQNLTAIGVFAPVGNIGAGSLFRIYKRARAS